MKLSVAHDETGKIHSLFVVGPSARSSRAKVEPSLSAGLTVSEVDVAESANGVDEKDLHRMKRDCRVEFHSGTPRIVSG